MKLVAIMLRFPLVPDRRKGYSYLRYPIVPHPNRIEQRPAEITLSRTHHYLSGSFFFNRFSFFSVCSDSFDLGLRS